MGKIAPGRLYKYQAFTERSLANLKSRTIWFARPSSFNDPFDCSAAKLAKNSDDELFSVFESNKSVMPQSALQPYVDGTISKKELVSEIKTGIEKGYQQDYEEISDQRGVCCLSESPDNLLMWSHYTDGHRGFCLEFDTTFEPFLSNAHAVTYSKELPILDGVKGLTHDGYNMAKPLLLTKFLDWSYEREWRLLHQEPDKAYTYAWQCLTGVYFGCAMPSDFREIVCLVLQGSPTKLYQMERDEDGYSINPVEKTYEPFSYKTSS